MTRLNSASAYYRFRATVGAYFFRQDSLAYVAAIRGGEPAGSVQGQGTNQGGQSVPSQINLAIGELRDQLQHLQDRIPDLNEILRREAEQLQADITRAESTHAARMNLLEARRLNAEVEALERSTYRRRDRLREILREHAPLLERLADMASSAPGAPASQQGQNPGGPLPESEAWHEQQGE
jgi:TolA-binding protein